MKKVHLKKIAENPNFIPDIYNYCDLWCERCPFTSQCEYYALNEEHFIDSESHDINNQIFWQNMTEAFQLPINMLKEIAKQEGIDLDSVDTKTVTTKEKFYRKTARNHECSRLAVIYGEMVDNWFTSAEKLFDEKEYAFDVRIQLEIPGTDPAAEMAGLKEVIDIICWYQYQIYIKLMRAIQGDIEGRSVTLDRLPRDSDGSAKIALIAMDRSIAAWENMSKLFPEQKDNILDLLLHLDRLRKKTEKVFPGAREFVRPGFDTMDPNQ